VYMGDKLHDEPELVQESHHELLADIVGRFYFWLFIIFISIFFNLLILP
jgi:hypothetical protein